jgi:hypothetical protein
MTLELESILESDIHYELPSRNAIFEEIKQMVMASLRHTKNHAILISLMLGTMHVSAQESLKITSQPIEIVVNNHGETPEFTEAELAFPQHFRMHQRMSELSSLEDNWDNAGGKKLSEKAISTAGSFIEALSEEVLSHCALFPAASSGLYIQGRFRKGSLIVTVSDKSITYVLKGDGIEKMTANQVPFFKETARKLNGIIKDNLI